MANPTVPFSWQMPEPTDLVTDLPADFEVFGQAVATDLQYLLGGTTGQVLAKASGTDLDFDWVTDATGMTNPMTTTADVIYSSSGSTPARLGIGTANQVLAVNSGATAPEWQTIASGGMTLLSTTTLSGATTTVSSLDQTYTDLVFIVQGAVFNTGSARIRCQPNGSGTTTWTAAAQDFQGTASVSGNQDYPCTPSNMKNTGGENVLVTRVFNYADSSYRKVVEFTGGGLTDASIASCSGGGYLRTTAAVTSVTVANDSSYTFTAGQLLIYGVK
jgi:hypothetical protein